jgi:hypothetical protein
LIKIINNEYTEKWIVPAIHDAVLEDEKKDDKKKKDTKKGKVEEEPEEVVPEVFDYTEACH